jgi:hypothetical protein
MTATFGLVVVPVPGVTLAEAEAAMDAVLPISCATARCRSL